MTTFDGTFTSVAAPFCEAKRTHSIMIETQPTCGAFLAGLHIWNTDRWHYRNGENKTTLGPPEVVPVGEAVQIINGYLRPARYGR